MREGWTYKKLGEVCDVYQPKTLATEQLVSDGKYFVYGANGVIGRYNDYNHEDSEVLLTCRGATCGTINISEPFSWINGNAMVIHRKSEELSFMYLKYLMSSLDYSNIITGAAQPQITRQKLAPTIVAVPPKSQQEAIVSELDEINSLLTLKREQLQKYDKLAQSLFYEMFGDPVENEKGWEVKKLDQLIEIGAILYHLDGNHGGDYPRSEEFTKTGVPYIGANSIKNGVIDFNLAKYLPEERAKMLKKGICQNEDVLFAHNATVGPVAILFSDCKVILSTSLTAYRCNKEFLLPYFLKMYMESNWFVGQYIGTMKQTTRNQIPITKQRKMNFIIPPLSLQQQFSTRIEQIESQKQQVQAAIEKLETLLASRMQYWFE